MLQSILKSCKLAWNFAKDLGKLQNILNGCKLAWHVTKYLEMAQTIFEDWIVANYLEILQKKKIKILQKNLHGPFVDDHVICFLFNINAYRQSFGGFSTQVPKRPVVGCCSRCCCCGFSSCPSFDQHCWCYPSSAWPCRGICCPGNQQRSCWQSKFVPEPSWKIYVLAFGR